MSDLDHFDFLPIQLDGKTQTVGSTRSSRTLNAELDSLNKLHSALLEIEHPAGVPPPPIPVNPKRSAEVSKIRDNGNAEFRKQNYPEAIKIYTSGIELALNRPLWEPQALVREEVAGLLANRAQAHMALQNWPEGSVDAEASVEARRVGNAKAWWRRGRCLMEMSRLEEAREWVKKGLEVEGEEGELVTLLKDIEGRIEKARAAL